MYIMHVCARAFEQPLVFHTLRLLSNVCKNLLCMGKEGGLDIFFWCVLYDVSMLRCVQCIMGREETYMPCIRITYIFQYMDVWMERYPTYEVCFVCSMFYYTLLRFFFIFVQCEKLNGKTIRGIFSVELLTTINFKA